MIYITLIGTLICPLRYEQHHLAFAKSNLWSARTSPTSPSGSAHDSSSLSIKGCSTSLMPSSLDLHGMSCLCTNSFDWLDRAGLWPGPKHQDARNPPFDPFPFFNHRPFSYSACPSSWITHPFSTHSAITFNIAHSRSRWTMHHVIHPAPSLSLELFDHLRSGRCRNLSRTWNRGTLLNAQRPCADDFFFGHHRFVHESSRQSLSM